MLAVLFQMWLYICHECILSCFIFCPFLNFELSDDFVIWQFLFLKFVISQSLEFFLELAKHSHSDIILC